jgi:cob(I)alamin adenosyltransferase
MVVLNRIYTRTGDDGGTMLGSGERLPKFHIRIAAYGTVDEVNSAIGVARLHTVMLPEIDVMLARVQNDLFDLGADLCSPDKGKGPGGTRLSIQDDQVARLEREIDTLNEHLTPLRSFVLPGGAAAAAHLHVARTACRRAERLMVELASQPSEKVSAQALKYINRLSDLLFVASRYANDGGARDVLWEPGKTRTA